MNIVKSKKKIYFPKALEDAPLSSALVITNTYFVQLVLTDCKL